MLLSVAALNTIIIMAVCANDGLPVSHYGWMSILVLYCAVRIAFWIRQLHRPIEPHAIPRLLRMNMGASLIMIAGLGTATTATFLAGTFRSELLIPMSLGFGATSIAHCLYTLRPAAIGTVVMGLFPSSIAMIAVGNFEAKMLGVSMISVGALMLRFVVAQNDQLIARLHLEKQNHDLANTDALTGLANRRAIMRALAELEELADSAGLAWRCSTLTASSRSMIRWVIMPATNCCWRWVIGYAARSMRVIRSDGWAGMNSSFCCAMSMGKAICQVAAARHLQPYASH